ncbi:hypothetical protein D0C36_16810 [Mucilaginibacter conchicola]|uniref:Uncharacterized protein n=1 Tax=Mucilaginibacter conchicola TaxID=2303333 RepID=A0A372NQH0_9SPHI|nr:hypothetical protein [Mucilaginibacter conchicola]RFZ90625.1 hypothetical protein D0C36_16810 [Mucilaginibacter conchicola]
MLRKLNRRISWIILTVIQALFLFMIFKENRHVGWISITIIVLLVLVAVAHFRAPLHHDDHLYENVFVAVWIPIGAITSYWLNHTLGLGPVIAAGIVGTTASFVPAINKRSDYLKHLPPAVYCGAFIGMSNLKVANGFLFVLAASVFAAIGLVLSKSLFNGMGGRLGLVAFSGVVIATVVLFLISSYAD